MFKQSLKIKSNQIKMANWSRAYTGGVDGVSEYPRIWGLI